MLKKIIGLVTALAVVSGFAAGIATAEDPAETDKWQFAVELYGYLPDIKGKSADGGDIEIPLDTILDKLQFTLMGIVGAKKGKWTFTTDLIYLNMGDDNSGIEFLDVDGQFVPVNVKTDLDMVAWIVTPAASYNVLDTDRFTLDILAGARYINLGVDVKLDVGPVREDISQSGGVWDGIAGVKGRVSLNDKWYLPYYLDIGTGQSDLTYQLYGGIAYRFTKIDLSLGYRYLRWNFDDDEVFDNLYQSGPMVGFTYRFR